MSIASELNALNGYILGAYDEIDTKGGTVPANKNMANLATAISSITTGGGGAYTIDISKTKFMRSSFSSLPDVVKVGTNSSSATDMSYMFCEVDGFNDLSGLENWTTSNVTDMSYMFQKNQLRASRITDLTPISNWDVSRVTTMKYMFSNAIGSINLSALSSWTTTSLTDMAYIFNASYGVGLITSASGISSWDTSHVTDMRYAFYYQVNLADAPSFSTTAVKDMRYMFARCSALTSVPQYTTSKVTSMTYMFQNCTSLTTVPVFDASSITTTGMQNMFTGCTALSNDSLNNIMATCMNATKITTASYKTLKYIGLTSAQATTCQSLSNYQDFIAAGWRTGY